MLGSSGGAVTALALVQAHPWLVHTVVAHEPPLEELLDDRDELRAHAAAMVERYRAGDVLGAWQPFLDAAGLPVPAEAMVAREPRDVADQRRWFLHEMRLSTAGIDSAGQVCDRTPRALAGLLDVEPELLPGG